MTEEAKKIFVGGVYWDAEKIEELIRNHANQNVEAVKSLRESLILVQKLQEENKKLEHKLSSYISAVDKVNNLWLEHGCKKNVSSCDICKMHSVLHNYLDKALSSGGE